MRWYPLPESELCYAKEGGATFVQTWDGVRVLAGGKEGFVPMAEWTEERGREVARCLTE